MAGDDLRFAGTRAVLVVLAVLVLKQLFFATSFCSGLDSFPLRQPVHNPAEFLPWPDIKLLNGFVPQQRYPPHMVKRPLFDCALLQPNPEYHHTAVIDIIRGDTSGITPAHEGGQPVGD